MAGFEGAFTDSQNWQRQIEKASGDVVSTRVDSAKTAEAIDIVGAAQVAARGGVNAQGYFNDVPAYQQLTANERAAVTNKDGTINSIAMLQRLNEKEAA